MSVENLTERTFPRAVLKHDGPVLVAFRAGWCAPSQQLQPILDEVAAEYEGRAKVVAVDVDDPRTSRLGRRFHVTRLPVTMLFDGGRVADVIGGMTSRESIADMVESRLKPVIDVDEGTFETEVLGSRRPVLVHVDAAWCDASRELVPVVEEMAVKSRDRARVVRLDFDANRGLCARYGIVRVPTIALFHGGQLKDQILGPMKGGTKVEGGRQTSCVGLTTFDNVTGMLDGLAV